MDRIDRASGLISAGEMAVVIMTDGHLFIQNTDNTGESGNWRINKNRTQRLNKVIIFIQKNNSDVREIFIADYLGIHSPMPSDQYKTIGRVVFDLINIREVGFTTENWSRFAETGSYPVRYLTK